MNAKTRKELATLITTLEEIKEKISQASTELDLTTVETAADDERSKFENMSEGLQQSENGQKLNEIADMLGEAGETLSSLDLDQVEQDLGEAISKIQEAIDR